LSATIGNADQIASWLGSIRNKTCHVVTEAKRPVPLYPLFLHPSGKLIPLHSGQASVNKAGKLHKHIRQYLALKRPPLLSPPGKLPPFGRVLAVLKKYNLLPAIFFLKSRRECDEALNRCEENFKPETETRQKREARLAELVSGSDRLQRHRHLWQIRNLAVASHHSGHLPAWKMIVETLMSEGHLDAVFATSTVAAGVDFPARSVLFLNSDRFNGVEFMPLDATELLQMTGRAGRRGKDKIGFAIVIPGKFMNLRFVSKLFSSQASVIESQIHINFSMTLNLLLSHTPDQVRDLLEKSFAEFRLKKKKKRGKGRPSQLWQDFIRHLDFLKQSGFVDKADRLTDDGKWTAQLRVDQPLLIAESLRKGLLPETDPASLAALAGAFVYEQNTIDDEEAVHRSATFLSHFTNLFEGLRPFARDMLACGFPVRPFHLRPAAALHAWSSGKKWETVVRQAGMPEGNLAMLILRTADNLRHIGSLSDDFPEVAENAKTAVDRILREPVVVDFS